MKQEEKQLLLKDLCARLPYGVIMGNKEWHRKPYQLTCNDVQYIMMSDDYEDVPYLRQMSSMTDEEKEEYHSIQSDIWKPCGTQYYDNWRSIDWLNEHHFDFRGLIPKGLAIEVNESNNPYND